MTACQISPSKNTVPSGLRVLVNDNGFTHEVFPAVVIFLL
jgi:hypothetical protein